MCSVVLSFVVHVLVCHCVSLFFSDTKYCIHVYCTVHVHICWLVDERRERKYVMCLFSKLFCSFYNILIVLYDLSGVLS